LDLGLGEKYKFTGLELFGLKTSTYGNSSPISSKTGRPSGKVSAKKSAKDFGALSVEV
jgi:hypothetical protein